MYMIITAPLRRLFSWFRLCVRNPEDAEFHGYLCSCYFQLYRGVTVIHFYYEKLCKRRKNELEGTFL